MVGTVSTRDGLPSPKVQESDYVMRRVSCRDPMSAVRWTSFVTRRKERTVTSETPWILDYPTKGAGLLGSATAAQHGALAAVAAQHGGPAAAADSSPAASPAVA